MRALMLLGVVLTASASSFAEVPIGYHEVVGIPTAEKIRAYEETVLQKESPFERIIGGVLAPASSQPYFASLRISLVGNRGMSLCGSSLLSANRLVTAAHCWWDGRTQARQFVVVLGSNFLHYGGTRIATSHVIVHPRWNYATLENDVAMIYLPTEIQYSASIRPISLPTGSEVSLTFEGQWAVAAGFGKTSDHGGTATGLSYVNLQVISNYFCRSVFNIVRRSTICTSGAGRVGICSGDSGGPLALNLRGRAVLIGISSFASKDTCQGGLPSGFSRVTSHINFINQHL